MNSTYLRARVCGIAAATMLGIAACSGSSTPPVTPPAPIPPPPMATIEVTISNLTNAQPLSPVAVVAHTDGYNPFSVGQAATPGLEMLAEAGDNTAFLVEADASGSIRTSASGTGPIPPGASETISVVVFESLLSNTQISVMTMLVNTNDAISGINAVATGDMQVGDSISRRAIAYDAGTEANTETAVTIPGPAGNGEGFNAARDDRVDQVTMHGGVVSRDDGFASSDLREAHRFDNPVVQVTLTRTL